MHSNITGIRAFMTSQSTEKTLQLSSTSESPGNDEYKSNSGTVAGIIVVCVFLVVSTIIGLIFYLKRREREVEPTRVFEKTTLNRVSETSTTWTELDVTSDRSSGRSTTDFSSEERDVELQPTNMFPLTPVVFSLYDDPELEEQNLTKTTETPNKEKAESYITQKSSSERIGRQVKYLELGDRNGENISENDSELSERKTTYNINFETGNRINSGKGEDSSNSFSVEGPSDTVSLNDDDSDDYEDVGIDKPNKLDSKSLNYEINNNEEIIGKEDDEDIYVNVSSDRLGYHFLEEAEIRNHNVLSKKHTSQREDTISRSRKAPLPRPRVSLKNSPSSAQTTDLNKQDVKHSNAEKQNDAPKPETSLNYSESIDNDTHDDDLGDYDSVDRIYDYPRNNRSIHGESEKL